MTIGRRLVAAALLAAGNCSGDCAKTWPPVLVDQGGKILLDGVDRSAVGVVKRDDGTLQVTIGGWPVYRFSKDQRAGDTNGQGVGGTQPGKGLSLRLVGGPVKIWSGPKCTGDSTEVTGDVADLSAIGFGNKIASIRFGIGAQ